MLSGGALRALRAIDKSIWVAIAAVPNVAQLEIFTVEESL